MTASWINELDLTRLNIAPDDKTTCKLMMLIEGTYGIGVEQAIEKYGYSEGRYYQLLRAFKRSGIQGLIDQKRGPKTRHVRSDHVIHQIIRLRFLDPQASTQVIAQKLRQMGTDVSIRSVERTITEYGFKKNAIS